MQKIIVVYDEHRLLGKYFEIALDLHSIPAGADVDVVGCTDISYGLVERLPLAFIRYLVEVVRDKSVYRVANKVYKSCFWYALVNALWHTATCRIVRVAGGRLPSH